MKLTCVIVNVIIIIIIIIIEDKSYERKGSACHLRLLRNECGWVFTFFSSKKTKNSFDINSRFVYAMRSIGKGHP